MSISEAEERLVMIIEGLNVRDTRKAVEYWRQSVDSPGDLNLDVQLERTKLSTSPRPSAECDVSTDG